MPEEFCDDCGSETDKGFCETCTRRDVTTIILDTLSTTNQLEEDVRSLTRQELLNCFEILDEENSAEMSREELLREMFLVERGESILRRETEISVLAQELIEKMRDQRK